MKIAERPLDTHYDGWLGILPKDIWGIIFKMVHQSCLQDVHSSILDKGKDVYGHFAEEYLMKERLPRPSKYVDIKLNQMGWEVSGSYRKVPPYTSNKLVYHLNKWSYITELKADCKQNGLKGYSRKKRKDLIRMLMSL